VSEEIGLAERIVFWHTPAAFSGTFDFLYSPGG
jgi:hypothetical protein